jgi:hypothetical protein
MTKIDSSLARFLGCCSLVCVCLVAVASVSAQDVAWTKYSYGAPASTDARFGGMNDYSGRLALVVDAAGNAIATGRVNTGAGMDWLTVKYDSSGNELWRAVVNGPGSIERLSAQVGASSTTFDEARAIALDSQGNVVVTGWTVADSPGGPGRCTIVKYSSNGTELWRKQPQLPSAGTWVESQCFSVAVDADGHIVTTGTARDSISQAAITAAIVIKHDSDGNRLWEDVLVSPAAGQKYESNRLAFDSQNNVFVTHYLQSSNVGIDGTWVIRKLGGANGAQMWRYERNNVNADDFALSIAVSQTVPARVAIVGYETVPTKSTTSVRASAVFLDATTGNELHQRYFTPQEETAFNLGKH